MKRFIGFAVVAAIIVLALGASQGWFSYSKESGFDVNQEKIQEDMGKAKEAVASGAQKVKEAAAAGADKVKEAAGAVASKTKEAWGTLSEKTKSALATMSEKAKSAYEDLKVTLTPGQYAGAGKVSAIDAAGGVITVDVDGEAHDLSVTAESEISVDEAEAAIGGINVGDEVAYVIDENGAVVRLRAAR